MSEQPFKEELLLIIKELEVNSNVTQRAISKKLGISLGKINYLFKELVRKGLIEAHNFTSQPGRIHKIKYILTSAGFEHKIKLMLYFLKIKEHEYNLLKQECERLSISNEKNVVLHDEKQA